MRIHVRERTCRISIESQSLRAVIADNASYGKDHRQGYSGILNSITEAQSEQLFVPAYSGLNFEHIFNGDSNSYLNLGYFRA